VAEFKLHQLPSALILVDGKLLLKDGGDPQELLRKFQKNAKIPDGTVVNIMPRTVAQRNWEAEQKQRVWDSTYSIAS